MTHNVYVVKLNNMPGILGNDLLQKGVKVDFCLGILEFKNLEMGLMNKSLLDVVSVRTLDECHIKPNSSMIMPAQLMASDKQFISSDLLL